MKVLAYLFLNKYPDDKKRIIGFFEAAAALIIGAICVTVFYRFYKLNLSFPIVYFGDTLSELAGIKKILSDGGEALGWPYHTDSFAYSPIYNAPYRILVALVGAFSGSAWAVPLNIYIWLIPIAVFMTTFLVARQLEIAPFWALFGAATFSCYPYIQGRHIWHPALEAVECVPIVFLLCIWLYEDDRFAHPQRGWLKYGRNIALIILSWLIANNGMIYYPFFTCFIFLVTGLIIAFEKKSAKAVLPALTCIISVVVWLGVGFIPSLIGSLRGVDGSVTQGATRTPEMAADFGLNIRSMLLSPRGWGNPDIYYDLRSLIIPTNENNRAYLGIVMSIGFVALLVCLLRGTDRDSVYGRRIALLSKLNISMLVLATINGLCVLVAIFLPYIRCYNRISPYIAFSSLLAVLLFIREKGGKKPIGIALWCAVFIISFIEMRDAYGTLPDWDYPPNSDQMIHDNEFFTELEEAAVSGSGEEKPLVFVLPYMRSFENGSAGFIMDYDHLKGYLFTDNVRWSYGTPVDSESDLWYRETAALPVDEMVEELRAQGFAGIYVNRNGYEDGYQDFDELAEAAGGAGIIGDGLDRYYIPITY